MARKLKQSSGRKSRVMISNQMDTNPARFIPIRMNQLMLPMLWAMRVQRKRQYGSKVSWSL